MRFPTTLLAALTLLLLPITAPAMFILQGEEVPVTRLLENVAKFVKDHPDDAQGYYLLGRLHSLAYSAGEKASVRTTNKDLPTFEPYASVKVPGRDDEKLDAATRDHLAASLTNYAKATKLAPENALYWMGRGWMATQAAKHSGDPDFTLSPDALATTRPAPEKNATQPAATTAASQPDAAALRLKWEDAALACFQKVIDVSLASDLKNPMKGPAADTVLSYEAIGYMTEILEKRPQNPETKQRIADLGKQREKFDQMLMCVTPIIFSLAESRSVSDLLAPNSTTTFDLAGNGRPALWPWLKPETCILAWDPQNTGRITSGRQLFGSATFWMFFQNGYQALASLDDNADGVLSAKELTGLAVWRDANSNGISDPGEVLPITHLKITEISVHPDAGTLQNTSGIKLENGRTLPTYDWVPQSLPRPKETKLAASARP